MNAHQRRKQQRARAQAKVRVNLTIMETDQTTSLDFDCAVFNSDLKLMDPHSPTLTAKQKLAIREECKVNPPYFFNKVFKAPPSYLGGAVRLTHDAVKEQPTEATSTTYFDRFARYT